MMKPSPTLVARPRRRRSLAAEQGMAVIAALVVVAAASVIAATIIDRQALLVDTLTVERDRADAQSVLRGGLEWARLILLNDGRRNAVTQKNAVWAQPVKGLNIRTPDNARSADFSGLIEDEQGKYNLGRLAEQGMVRPHELAVLQHIMSALDVPVSLARPIAQRIANAQGAANRPPSAPGINVLSDLTGIADLTPAMIATLSNHVTVVPAKTGVNVNTASPVVLSAIIPGLTLMQARTVAAQRDRGHWFNDDEDFLKLLPIDKVVPALPLHVRSNWFKVTGEAVIRGVPYTMQALLHRQGNEAPALYWIRG